MIFIFLNVKCCFWNWLPKLCDSSKHKTGSNLRYDNKILYSFILDHWQSVLVSDKQLLFLTCLGNKVVKPVGRYLQAASTHRCFSFSSGAIAVCKNTVAKKVGVPPSILRRCRADSFPAHSAARQQHPRVINKASQCSRGHTPNYSARHQAGFTTSFTSRSSERWTHTESPLAGLISGASDCLQAR